MDDSSFHLRIPKKLARTALVVVVTTLIVAPLTAIASHSFTDVPDSNIFHADIEWLKDAGVTKGCNPPDNTEFCPKEAVNREAMAAFMRRFAQYLGAEDGIPAQADHATTADNADTVDGKHANAFLGVTEKAADSDKLDGNDASAFLGSNDTAVDSDKLDGKHANELTRVALGSNDQAETLSTTFNTHSTVTIEAPKDGFILLTAGVTIQNDQSDPCSSDCEIMAVIEWVAGGQTEFSMVSQMDAAAGSQQAVPLTWVFPVHAGSQQFDLRVRRFVSTGGTIEAQFSQITALYSPFGASGEPFPSLSMED